MDLGNVLENDAPFTLSVVTSVQCMGGYSLFSSKRGWKNKELSMNWRENKDIFFQNYPFLTNFPQNSLFYCNIGLKMVKK